MLSDKNYEPQKCQGLWDFSHNYCGRVWLLSLKRPALMHTTAKVVRCVPCCQQRIKPKEETRKSRLLIFLLVTKFAVLAKGPKCCTAKGQFHKIWRWITCASNLGHDHWHLLTSLPRVLPPSYDQLNTDEGMNNVESPWVTRGAQQFLPSYAKVEGCKVTSPGKDRSHISFPEESHVHFLSCKDPKKANISTIICVKDFKD